VNDWYTRAVSPDDAVSAIPRGARIVVSSYGGEPRELIDALLLRPDISEMTCYQSPRGTSGRLVESGCRFVTYAPDRRVAAAISEGSADYLPSTVFRACQWAEEGRIQIDAAILNISPPDENGFCSFGTSTDFVSIASERSPLVIAQINELMPRTTGHAGINLSRIDHFIVTSQPLVSVAQPEVTKVALEVADNVASLVPDGSTIEVGTGSVPAAILQRLANHNDLGVHTGLMSDAFLPLIETGVITGSRKSRDQGEVVANQLTGSMSLYEWAARASELRMRSASYTHDPRVIGSLDNFVAINSAIQIDLQGQINSEWLHDRRVSGTGGSLDFAIGAAISREGRSIIAVTSTAGRNEVSRIVPALSSGCPVTVPSQFVDYVVTEYGIAALAGLTARERCEALIAVAHPSHRSELRGAVK
jgi:4-hydroxybutyrate CoA-transferase